MKILWASPNTLLDTTNGAALMVKECLHQLANRSCTVTILSSTSFVNLQGMTGRHNLWSSLKTKTGRFVDYQEDGLIHRLLVTEQPRRRWMRSYEEQRWFDEYLKHLDHNRPDIVLFFDNSLITLLTAEEAQQRGIKVGVFLMHGNNSGQRWCRDVNRIFTDTRATAEMYRMKEGYDIVPLGTFVDPSAVLASVREPKYLLFINPIPSKGAVLVVQLALWLERYRPDIKIEVVDSRNTWAAVVMEVTKRLGQTRRVIEGVTVTPNTIDMRPVYGRARLLLVPSLWWESGPRVIVEAMANGVPVVGSNSGGIPEILGRGGEVFEVPEDFRAEPYLKLFAAQFVGDLAHRLLVYFDDDGCYGTFAQAAIEEHRRIHNLERNVDGLLGRLRECLQD